MPIRYRRRKVVRRPRRRVRRAGAKRTNLSGTGLHYFKRRYVVANVTASTSGAGIRSDAAGAMSFNLNSLPNSSEFSALFDEYKIMKVSLKWVPFGDSVDMPIATMTGTSSLLSPGGPLITVVDYDDNTAPTAAADLLQYQTSKVTPIPKPLSMTIRPKFATEVYRSGLSTAYGARTGWLDTDSADVPHYGVKYYMNAPSALNSSYTYQVWADVTLALKGVK